MREPDVQPSQHLEGLDFEFAAGQSCLRDVYSMAMSSSCSNLLVESSVLEAQRARILGNDSNSRVVKAAG
jgi:hypothetical protein